MGQECSCLQHPRKPRRQSDDLDTASDMERTDDDQELDILVDHTSDQESRGLLSASQSSTNRGARNSISKRNGATAVSGLLADEEEKESDEQHMRRSLSIGLMGIGGSNRQPTPSPRPEELSSLLRSYQEKTGVVDEGQLDLECIMCLDTFSEDNPKVRTLCNCGMNRTNFHMSCLLEWLNRDANCPVCREYLFFEDS
ncbi:hypothetical protein PHYBOEH_005097 [Phytophthora boehmeriae]|uniref:RING-type E3 ubiquitin transferase n=1 Tax=Phytophthora boehmeriae TaxID=109152 RepID=A0A8T1X5H3_9STRA|nr:hypothetical protein PHYBOEH_005097 [Phytophthora boehmeriae]